MLPGKMYVSAPVRASEAEFRKKVASTIDRVVMDVLRKKSIGMQSHEIRLLLTQISEQSAHRGQESITT